MDIQNLNDVLRTLGRGIVFYAPKWTPGMGNTLALTHLGDTEGDIVIATNAEVATLTLPEITGPAVHEGTYTGENPVITLPLFLADPLLRALISPGASEHAGRTMRIPVSEYTLAIFPEELFRNATNVRGVLTFPGGVWKLDDVALTEAQLALLDTSLWAWRGFFNRPPITYHGLAGDPSKNIESASFQAMQHPDMDEGHQLFTSGDPYLAGIDLEGGS